MMISQMSHENFPPLKGDVEQSQKYCDKYGYWMSWMWFIIPIWDRTIQIQIP